MLRVMLIITLIQPLQIVGMQLHQRKNAHSQQEILELTAKKRLEKVQRGLQDEQRRNYEATVSAGAECCLCMLSCFGAVAACVMAKDFCK